jgi:hypothetical protein
MKLIGSKKTKIKTNIKKGSTIKNKQEKRKRIVKNEAQKSDKDE